MMGTQSLSNNFFCLAMGDLAVAHILRELREVLWQVSDQSEHCLVNGLRFG